MDLDAIRKEIRQFVFENFILDEEEELSDDESFFESGLLDSTGILELLTFLEERFDIEVEDQELVPDNLDGIEKATRFVASKRGA